VTEALYFEFPAQSAARFCSLWTNGGQRVEFR
jgi:hypothetical protein